MSCSYLIISFLASSDNFHHLLFGHQSSSSSCRPTSPSPEYESDNDANDDRLSVCSATSMGKNLPALRVCNVMGRVTFFGKNLYWCLFLQIGGKWVGVIPERDDFRLKILNEFTAIVYTPCFR